MNQSKKSAARRPSQITATGWKHVGLRIKDQLAEDHISIVSAGVAYYFFLALFPTLIAAISIFGLIVDPAQVQQQMSQMANILPQQTSQMISGILENIAGKSGQTLGWSLAVSILLSLWTAQQGTKAVFEGINIAYNQVDERGFFKRNGLTLLFTLAGIIVGTICTALVVVFPAIVEGINLPSTSLESLIQWLRWPILALIIMGALGLTYKIAPYHRDISFRWVSWGAVTATILWLAGSLLFSFYISNFGNYDQMYGSFAAAIILMLWFFITAYVILLGAEINSEIERQTLKDTTIDKDDDLDAEQQQSQHTSQMAKHGRNPGN